MINTVNGVKYNDKNSFIDLKKQSNYWLNAENSDNNLSSLSFIDDFKFMTPEEARKTKNIKIIGLSIAGTMIFTAGTILVLLKGGPKGLTKNINKLRDILEAKIQKAKLEENSNTTLNKIYEYLSRKSEFLVKHLESINNFTTIKDFSFKKIMSKNKKTSKIHSFITKRFEKIGRSSVISSYEETSEIFARLAQLNLRLNRKLLSKDLNKKITIDGKTKTLKSWLYEISKLNYNYEHDFVNSFSESALGNRYKTIKTSARKMEQDFNKKGISWFLSRDTLEKFVADSKISSDKLRLQKSVIEMRRKLSYSLEDVSKDAEKRIMRMTELIDFRDIEKIKALRNIEENFKNIAKSTNPEDKKILQEKLLKSFSNFYNLIHNSDDTHANAVLLSELKCLENSYMNYKSGNMEKILNIYKHLLSPSEYSDIEHAYKGSIVSLDNSIKIETEDFFNKVRDLTLGGAPTDVLSILGAFTTLSYYLGKSDDNKERISITLKYGIPALVTIGTSFFCNAKLFAGTKSLFLASISGLLAGKAGDIANDLFMNYSSKKA